MTTKMETKAFTFRSRPTGRRVPNLVMEYDSEKGYEFRVQCEVGLTDPVEGARLKDDLEKKNPDALKRAKELAISRIDSLATPRFKKIVADAFDDNIEKLKSDKPEG